MQQQFSNDQIEVIRRSLLKPKRRECTQDELDLFIAQCNRTQLDPFSRQIYGLYRWNKTEGVEKLSIQVSIDGFRLVAERTGKYEGQDGPFWCGADGQWVDVWLQNNPPVAAKVGVWKTGARAVTFAVAKFSSYAQKYENKLSGMWATMPEMMIAKCAESLALRKAFPQELSGLYTSEEMDQADDKADIAHALPAQELPASEIGKVPPKNPSGIKPPQAKRGQAPVKPPETPPAAPPPVPANVDAETGEVYDDRGEESQEQPLDELRVETLTFKDGKKSDGSDYRVYFVTCSDGKVYSTFDEQVAQFAQLALDEKRGVLITSEQAKVNKAGKSYFPIVQIS